MSYGQSNLGKIERSSTKHSRLSVVRYLLPLGWVLAAIGYAGPWIAHSTSALQLSGIDMGEFVKFLPDPEATASNLIRQVYYLPPLVTVLSVGLLLGSRSLGYAGYVRIPFVGLALWLSIQLLPPAWSPSSLTSPEFRLQLVSMMFLWILLAIHWVLASLPAWIPGLLTAVFSAMALGLVTWRFLVVKPAIDAVYGAATAIGWGLPICLAGLLILALSGVFLIPHQLSAAGTTWGRP